MKKLMLLSIAVLMISAAASATVVTGAGGGIYGSGVTFNGVLLTGLRFGIGVDISSNGTSAGDFQSTLTSAAQEITIAGKSTAGSVSVGNTTFSGNCTVDMGNGTPLLQNVPFIATIGTDTNGKPAIALTIGATSLPAVNITKGSTSIK